MRVSRFVSATTLIVLVVLPSTSFAEWTKVGENVEGTTYYVDFKRIKKNSGYVYYWEMGDYLKPTPAGWLSAKALNELDCNVPRKARILSISFYKGPMGQGDITASDNKPGEWWNASPDSAQETIFKLVCDYAGE